MSKEAKVLEIPFDEDGNQQHYPNDWKPTEKWKQNYIFEDTLKFDLFFRGRSAAYAILKSEIDGKQYTMFLVDLENSFISFKNGKAEGKWTFCKRGANYGIRRAGI